MNAFQLYQLKRIDIILYLEALLAYNEAKRTEIVIDVGLMINLSLSRVFAKALAVNVLVKRLQRRMDTQVLEQMKKVLGTQYTKEFCERYNFPFPKQIVFDF
jgi:hypothetical protein